MTRAADHGGDPAPAGPAGPVHSARRPGERDDVQDRVSARTRTSGRSGRRPGASGTREAIAAAARRQFAERGFDAVTVRSIAAEARVDPALVLRFSGSKEALFGELVALPIDPATVLPQLLAGGADGLGRRLARFVIGQLGDPVTREAVIGLLRTAAAHPQAATAIRERYQHELLEPVATSLAVDHPQLRAALCSSQLIGLAMAGHVIGLPPLQNASADTLTAVLGETLQRYLTHPLDDPIEPALGLSLDAPE